MRKRPVFAGAVVLALLIWIIFGIMQIQDFSSHVKTSGTFLLHGTFLKAEEKSRSMSVYLERVSSYEKTDEPLLISEQVNSGVHDKFFRHTRNNKAANDRFNKETAQVLYHIESARKELSEVETSDRKKTVQFYHKILLVMDKETFHALGLLPGNEIEVPAKQTGFQKARNKGNYDEEAYFHSLGVVEKFSTEGEVQITSHRIYPVRTAMVWMKERLNNAILSACGEGNESLAAVFSAIVTGDRSGLDAETKELYRKSGIAHILAISGLHISLLGMGLFSILRKRLSFLPSALISGLIMILFCILSGESASAVRATIMFLIRLVALWSGKKFDLLSALGLSAILLLLSNPRLLFYTGFQLSFGAIAGIGLLQPAIQSLLAESHNKNAFSSGLHFQSDEESFDQNQNSLPRFQDRRCTNRKEEMEIAGHIHITHKNWSGLEDGRQFISQSAQKNAADSSLLGGTGKAHRSQNNWNGLRSAFSASFAVTLFTLPIIINTYFELPVFSVLLNLAVVPLMGLVLGSGLFSAIFGMVSLFFSRFAIGIGVFLVSVIEWLCALNDKIPFSVVICGHMSLVRVLLYYGILFGFILLTKSTLDTDKNRSAKRPATAVSKGGIIVSRLSGMETSKRSMQNKNQQDLEIKSAGIHSSGTSFPNGLSAIRRWKKIILLLGMVTALIIVVFVNVERKNLKITMFDVDQGECILMESPSGTVYMIDGGSSSVTAVYRYRMESALKYRGITKIDYVILTHPDLDHLSGIMEMMEKKGAGSIRIRNILTPAHPGNKNYDALVKQAEASNIPLQNLNAGMTLKDSELSLRCLHPEALHTVDVDTRTAGTAAFASGGEAFASGGEAFASGHDAFMLSSDLNIAEDIYAGADTNAASAVIELNYGSFKALFTGDIGLEEEKKLLQHQALTDCDLLKVAHHGSKYATGKQFLDVVQPEIAIVSAGINNSYGHPSPDVLERLEEAGAKTYSTPENGALTVTISPEGTTGIEGTLRHPAYVQ